MAGGLSEFNVTSETAFWTAGANFSFAGDNVTYGLDDGAYVDSDGAAPFAAFFEISFTVGPNTANAWHGIYLNSDAGSLNTNNSRCGVLQNAGIETWSVFADTATTTNYYKNVNRGNFGTACGIGDVLKIRRAADGTVTSYRNGGLVYTWPETTLASVSFALGSGAATAERTSACSWTYWA